MPLPTISSSSGRSSFHTGLVPYEGFRCLRAPPVELVASGTPVVAVPLAHRGGDPSVVRRRVLAPQRKLPADVRFQLERVLSPLERGPVKRAAWTAWETGAVQEDAGACDCPGDDLPVLAGAGESQFALLWSSEAPCAGTATARPTAWPPQLRPALCPPFR